MFSVILQAASYLFTMAMGYVLKRFHVVKKEDSRVLAGIIMCLTLPATLISGFAEAQVSYWYLISIGIGFLANGLALLCGFLASLKKDRIKRALYIINTPGFNLGNVATPYLQAFFPAGIPYLCMFDIADSLYTLGGTNAIAQNMVNEKKQLRWQVVRIFASLFSSVPFITSLVMTVISLAGIPLPGGLFDFTGFLAKANGPLAMLMVGISLEFSITKSDLKDILTILCLRYGCALISALCIFYLLPAPLIMRQVLSIAVFSAVPNISLIFSNRIDSTSSIASSLNPISLILSIPLMSVIIVLMQNAA